MYSVGPIGSISGSGDSDILVVTAGGTGAVYAGAGDDIVLDNFGFIPNYLTSSTAYNFDGAGSQWFTAATGRENPLVGDDTIPTASVLVNTAIGAYGYFTVSVGAGETLTLDIDAGVGSLGTSGTIDTVIQLTDYNNPSTVIGTYDDAGYAVGGAGSVNVSDAYATYTNTGTGVVTVLVRIGQYSQTAADNLQPFATNTQFLLFASLTHHATTGSVASSASDHATLDGGDGYDLISGGAGADTIWGGLGGDDLYGGTGDDQIYVRGSAALTDTDGNQAFGGDGNDMLFSSTYGDRLDGGAGTDMARYDNSTANLDIDLALGTASGGDAEGDILVSIEHLQGGSHHDALAGDENANTLNGLDGYDVLTGRGGDDTLDGGNQDDSLYGGLGADTLYGGEGNDYILGGRGRDTVKAGGGDDLIAINGTEEFDAVDGGDGTDFLDLSGSDRGGVTYQFNLFQIVWKGAVFAVSNLEGLYDANGGNTIIVPDWDFSVYGNDGNDVIYGGTSAHHYVIAGGNGNDRIIIKTTGLMGSSYAGDAGVDSIDFSAATKGLYVDLVAGTINTPALPGNSATIATIENVIASQYGDTMIGDGLQNILNGGLGDDDISGGAGNDFLVGGGGDDTLAGGLGNDTFNVDSLGDVLIENAGEGLADEVRVSGLSWTLAANFENLTILTGTGSGTGNSVGNVITGSSAANVLSGYGGADTLDGGKGNDTLLGGNGADRLIGGEGRDTLTGGAAADRFVWTALADSAPFANTADRITDFSHAELDRIDLSALDAVAATAGDEAFAFIGADAFHGVAGELRYRFDGAGSTIVQMDVDGDGASDCAIVLTGEIALVAGDFVL